MTPTKLKRIACLFRELAQAFDELEEPAKKVRPKVARENLNRAAEEATRLIRNGLRKQGIRLS